MKAFTPIGSQCNNPACRKLFVDNVNRCPACDSSGAHRIYNFYTVLEVSPGFTTQELKAQYKRLSLQHHPDVNGGEQEKFLIIKQAYESLQERQTRETHDRCLEQIQEIKQGCFKREQRKDPYIFWEEFSEPFYEEVQHIQKVRHTCGVLGSILGISYSIFSGSSLIMCCILGYMVGSFYPQIGKLLLLLCNVCVFLITVHFSLIALQTRSVLMIPLMMWLVHWYIKNIPRWESELE